MSAELVSLAFKLLAVGINEVFIVRQVAEREAAGHSPREIARWMSELADKALEPITQTPNVTS